MIKWLDKTYIEENIDLMFDAEFENYANEIFNLVL